MLAPNIRSAAVAAVLLFSAAGARQSASSLQTRVPVPIDITGQLTDFAGAAIPDARVGVSDVDRNGWIPFATADRDGRYKFTARLIPGQYSAIAVIGQLPIATALLDVPSTQSAAIVNLVAPRVMAQVDELPAPIPIVKQLAPRARPAASLREPPAALIGGVNGPGPTAPTTAAPSSGPNQELVNVYFATDCAPDGANYSVRQLNSDGLTFGVSVVSIPPTHQPGELERPSIFRLERVEDPKRHIVARPPTRFGTEVQFDEELHRGLTESGSEAFLFIHGYNVNFDDGVRRTAQLFRDLKFNGVALLFAWPGQDAWWRYLAAEDVVEPVSRDLEHVIVDLAQNENVSAINIVAHSMGNRVLKQALDRIALRNVIHQPFRNVVMAAPDINVAEFNEVVESLKTISSHTTIYSSSHDVALAFSSLFHTFPRLGQAPPTHLDTSIDTIDASNIKQDLLGHSYFGDSQTVLKDLVAVLKDGLPPTRRGLDGHPLGSLLYWLIRGGG